jgi:hypothetical protein
VDAKQDAIEVASFAEKLDRAKKRSLALAAVAGLVGTAALVASVYLLVALRAPIPQHHNCRTIFELSVRGNDAVRIARRVCPGDNDPFATATTAD